MAKKFDLKNMNGDTQDDKKSCSLDDMFTSARRKAPPKQSLF